VRLGDGFNCVDVRQLYQPFGKTEWKPTRSGIALRLSEWETSRNVVVNVVQRSHPIVARRLSGVQSVHYDAVSSRSIKGDPFVLERRTKLIKKCRLCGKDFVDEKFVIRHEKKIYFVKNDIRRGHR